MNPLDHSPLLQPLRTVLCCLGVLSLASAAATAQATRVFWSEGSRTLASTCSCDLDGTNFKNHGSLSGMIAAVKPGCTMGGSFGGFPATAYLSGDAGTGDDWMQAKVGATGTSAWNANAVVPWPDYGNPNYPYEPRDLSLSRDGSAAVFYANEVWYGRVRPSFFDVGAPVSVPNVGTYRIVGGIDHHRSDSTDRIYYWVNSQPGGSHPSYDDLHYCSANGTGDTLVFSMYTQQYLGGRRVRIGGPNHSNGGDNSVFFDAHDSVNNTAWIMRWDPATPNTLTPVHTHNGSICFDLDEDGDNTVYYADSNSTEVRAVNWDGSNDRPVHTTAVPIDRVELLRARHSCFAGVSVAGPFGAGCYAHPVAFFETFQAGGFDLSNSTMTLFPTGPNYYVTPSGAAFVPPFTGSLTAVPPAIGNWNDGLAAPIALPFTFPFPGGSASSVQIGSNGIVYLGASATRTAPYAGNVADVQNEIASLAPAHGDFDLSPALGGSLHYEVDPINTSVRITWLNVPEFNAGSPGTARSTFQLVLDVSGRVDCVYQTVSCPTTQLLTGFCSGYGAALPAPRDLSASMPFASGDGSEPAYLDLDQEPILGTTVNLVTRGIGAGTTINFTVLGFAPFTPGIPLDILGMPGCQQLVAPSVSYLSFVLGGTASVSLAIPNVTAYLGAQLFAQSAPFTAGGNAAGIVTSNGLAMMIGQ